MSNRVINALFPSHKRFKDILKILKKMEDRDPKSSLGNKLNSIPFQCEVDIKHIALQANKIAELCDQYGSDKGSTFYGPHPYTWPPHTYAVVYDLLFNRPEIIKAVFECGIGTNNANLPSNMTANGRPGASLYVWRDYFPNATIYGADIDTDILFKDERIITGHIDQTNPQKVKDYFESIGVKQFDIMIDDGLHKFEAGKCLFENSFDFLADDGLYIIEDVLPEDVEKYHDYFKNAQDLVIKYVLMGSPKSLDNNLIIIRKAKYSR